MTVPAPVPPDQLPPEALRPVAPAYGTGSLADLLPSVSAVLGVPGAADVLGLTARLDGVDRVAVLLVDGLGAYQVPVMAPYAPVLADLAASSPGVLTSGFPSTTPVSLTTLGTGAAPGRHGVLGFTVRRPDGQVLNHIRWGADPDPLTWQPLPTCYETAVRAGVPVTMVTRPEFSGTGLTVASQRGGTFVAASTVDELATGLLAALATGPGLVYGYHADLDKSGHQYGVGSVPWQLAARDVDRLLDMVVHRLPARSALIVVADHGQLNVPAADRIDMSEISDLSEGVVGVSGEPRVRYLYCAPGAEGDVMAAWRGVFGSRARVQSRDEAITAGYFGPVPDEHRSRIGDVVVTCLERVVALAGAWEPPAVAQLIGFHGSTTAAEMTVPLLVARP